MATWRICDEHWYWFTTFKTDMASEEQKGINRALNQGTIDDINLWRCRHCGAMVPGVARTVHLKFHIATNTQYLYGDLEKDTYENTLRKASSDCND
jgi:hypothetical protein